MAADQILTGNESYPAAGSGIGAVVLNDDEGQKNLDEAITNANNELEMQRKAQVAALENSQVIMKGLKLDPNGARPQDITTTLQPQAQKIMENAANINGAFNGNSTSPQARLLWQKNVVQPQQQFQADLDKSKAIAKLQVDANNEIKSKPDNYDQEYYNQNTAHIASLPLNDPALDKVSVADLIKQKQPDFDLAVDKFIKNAYPKGIPLEPEFVRNPLDPNTTLQHNQTYNISKDKIQYLADNYESMPEIKRAVDDSWAKMQAETPGTVTELQQPYLDKGISPVLADKLARRDWVYGKTLNGHYNLLTDSYKSLGRDEAGQLEMAQARASAQDDKNILYGPAQKYADILNHVPGKELALVGTQLPKYQAIQFKADGVTPEKDAQGNIVVKPMDNAIEKVVYNDDGTTTVYTTESKDKAAQANWQHIQNGIAVNSGMTFSKNDGRTLASIAETANKTGNDLNNMDKAYRKAGAIDQNGNWIPDTYTAYYAKKAGIVQPNTSTSKTTVTKTNGAPASAKKGDEKQVQGGTAVYDGTKWVMKQ